MQTLLERLARLGEAVRRAEDLAEAAREARDKAIDEGAQAGLSVRQLAGATGVSRPRTHQIILDQEAARQARIRDRLQV